MAHNCRVKWIIELLHGDTACVNGDLTNFPQLWNVLKGDMSLVGPRPERALYVQQIQEKEALHARIYITKPGLTSLGMVKFGYARNLEEIMERMRYDMIYLDNQSIFFDLQILLFTIRTVILGKEFDNSACFLYIPTPNVSAF